jgi:hypothetical protein
MEKHHWTDEEREIVRRDYQHTHASRREIARRLGVTEFAVAGQIATMGIAKRSDRRPWSPEEDERLRELIYQYAPHTVARRMGRSLNSVVVRSKRLGCSRRIRDGWFTKKEVCEILGVDHKWVQKRIDAGQLKASWHNGSKPTNSGSACWHILEKDLKEFIRRYPQDLTARNLDLIMVVDMLAGVAS